MASVTYGMCYLWQRYYAKCNYGKSIIENETEPTRSSYQLSIGVTYKLFTVWKYIYLYLNVSSLAKLRQAFSTSNRSLFIAKYFRH